MKKKVRSVLLLALAVMMAVSAAGCSGGTKTADMDVAKVMDAMLEKAPIEGGIELSQDDMLNFYGIQSEDMEAFAANLAADGITAKEIVLVKAKDEDSAKTVESKLQSRLDAATSSTTTCPISTPSWKRAKSSGTACMCGSSSLPSRTSWWSCTTAT